jgi:hypothetical protein
MKMLVIGSCTKSKHDSECPKHSRLSLADLEDPLRLRVRQQELAKWLRPAAEMYTGRQHTQMMDGVRLIRSAFGSAVCDVVIVSAGYGLLAERTRVAPYDITFHGKSKTLIRARGERMGIPKAVRHALTGYSVAFVLLGDDYLLSVSPPLAPLGYQKLIAFGSPKLRQVLGRDVVVVPAGTEAARQFRDGVTTLKGRMFHLLAKGLIREPEMWNELLRDQTPQTVLTLIRLGMQIG